MTRVSWAILAMVVFATPGAGQTAVAPALGTVQGAFFAASVADLDASIKWYTEKLGLTPITRFGKQGKVDGALLSGGGLEVELIAHDDATEPRDPLDLNTKVLTRGIFKSGLRVGDFDSVLATLRARGIEIAMGPFPARPDQRANMIVRDNSGNLIQILGDYARSSAGRMSDSLSMVGRQFLAVSVSNIDASQRWYQNTFGLPTARTLASADTNVRTAIVESEVLVVELSMHRTAKPLREYAGRPTPGYLVHGFFKGGLFVSSLDSAVATLRRRGVTGVSAVMSDADATLRWVFLRDPDGNFVQLLETAR